MNLKIISLVFLVFLGVLFIVQNVAIVEVQFLFWSIEMSQSLLIFLLLAIGIIIGWFLHGYYRFRKGKSI
jgi:putative membrane protein